MVHKKILSIFYENPSKSLHIRGIAKELNIPKTSVSYHIEKLLEEKMIVKDTTGIFTSFRANSDDNIFVQRKIQDSIMTIVLSGVIDYIRTESSPKCIVLFGSFAKGEYDINSDIDIFVQSKDIKLSLSSYEKKLKHKINILFENNIEKMSSHLLNNIINGAKLQGFLKVK